MSLKRATRKESVACHEHSPPFAPLETQIREEGELRRAPRNKNDARKRRFLFLGGGAERDRTVDLLTASQALSQLSYSPTR